MTEQTPTNTARALAALERAKQEDAILAQLPQGDPSRPLPWRCYLHRSEAHISLEPRRYGRAFTPSMADVAALGLALPALPLALYRAPGNSTTIQAAEAAPPRGYAPDGALDICPFWLQADADKDERNHRIIVRWYTRIGAQLARVSITMDAPEGGTLGGWDISHAGKTSKSAITGGSFSLPAGLEGGICAAEPDPETGGRPALAMPETFGWWTPQGSPPSRVVYFCPLGERGRAATLADLARELRAGMRYSAEFHGRTVGAIGVSHRIATTVEAPSPEAARLALYDRFEHISGLKLTPIGPAEPTRGEG